MDLSDIIIDLHGSGYSDNQIIAYVQEMYDIEIRKDSIKIALSGKRTKIKEYQNRGTRVWQLALEKCPVDVYKTYYNPESGEYNRVKMIEDLGLTRSEIELIKNVIISDKRVDCFSIATTKAIFEADGYCCRRCGVSKDQEKVPLETHHITPGGGEDFSNGITLCRSCHYFVHKKRPPISYKEVYTRKTWNKYVKKYKINARPNKKNALLRNKV